MIAIQIDLCDTIYVTKDTLAAYTIAVVQNTQTLQFEQMQIALQTAQNQASIETPLWSQQLMYSHFNLAILTDDNGHNINLNAQASETNVVDGTPSTSVVDQETYVKTPSRSSSGTNHYKKTQPINTVRPTCRGNPDLVHGIPTGYDSDDSWGNNSAAGSQTVHVAKIYFPW